MSDKKETVELDLTTEEELLLYRAAHAADMSVNQFVEQVLINFIEQKEEQKKMIVDLYLISGLMCGFEYVELDGEDDIEKGIVIDLFILRIMFLW